MESLYRHWLFAGIISLSLAISAQAQRDFGVDVSHYQGSSGISQAAWNQMYAEGKRFVFIKATEGLTGPHDPAMANNVMRAKAAGLQVGVYHFAHPENRPTTNGAIQEADQFMSYAGAAIGPGYLRPVLDLEGQAAILGTAELTDWVIAFCDRIVQQRGSNAVPIIYCNQPFANYELDSRMANYDLWLRTISSTANVNTDQPPSQGYPKVTGVFNNWAFWQYSATGSAGGISPVDLNVCHSEYKPLDWYLIPDTTPPTPPSVTTQPRHKLISMGDAARFTVSANGTPPLQYQWRFNDTPIPGATLSAYTCSNAQTDDAGPYSVVVSNSGGSVTSAVASLVITAPSTLFEDNFEHHTSPTFVTTPGVSRGYHLFFGAASGPTDFTAAFGFDYSTINHPLPVPTAPASGAGTKKGLLLTVNKDATAAAAAINLYPTNQSFSGNFALKFDMWINWTNASSATEHAMFGINHSGSLTNRIGQAGSDGLFFAVSGDGGITTTSPTLRDYSVFNGGGPGALPILLLPSNTTFGPAPLLGPQFDNTNPGIASLLPSKIISGYPSTPQGSAGLGWISAEVRQENNLITWLLNDTIVAQYTNFSAFTNGNLLLGYSDNFASIGD
ncbi:MAG: GH25 family lysozyme, partial [Limisphaerales bacterium]